MHVSVPRNSMDDTKPISISQEACENKVEMGRAMHVTLSSLSFFGGKSVFLLKLQMVQNAAARLLSGTRTYFPHFGCLALAARSFPH